MTPLERLEAVFNDLVTGLEDPDLMRAQALRNRRDALAAVGEELARAAAEDPFEEELTLARNSAERWRGRAEEAVAGGHEELARNAVQSAQEQDRLVVSLETEQKAYQEYLAKLRQTHADLEARFSVDRREHNLSGARDRLDRIAAKLSALGMDGQVPEGAPPPKAQEPVAAPPPPKGPGPVDPAVERAFEELAKEAAERRARAKLEEMKNKQT